LDSTDPPNPGDRPPSSHGSRLISAATAPEKILTHACWQRCSVPRAGICRCVHERSLDFTMANVLKCPSRLVHSRATVNTVSNPPCRFIFFIRSVSLSLTHSLSRSQHSHEFTRCRLPHGCRYMNTREHHEMLLGRSPSIQFWKYLYTRDCCFMAVVAVACYALAFVAPLRMHTNKFYSASIPSCSVQ
jgi:hypothetical protein